MPGITLDKSNPYYEKKGVILCRSGIQEYQHDEVTRMMADAPPEKKPVYKVYRPASVIIAALEKMKELPLTVEHPPEFLNGHNWSLYAKGYTGSEATLVPLGDDEIGVRSRVIFSTAEVYNYYVNGNEEVSLGYEAVYAWVDNAAEVGYDIIMVAIDSVNHLAITAAGRGGYRVSIIDSLIGGIRSMKTGLFHFLAKKGKTADSKETKLSSLVFDALEKSKTLDDAAMQNEIKKVTDSLSTLKDGDKKDLLVSVVKDCFSAPDTAIGNKEQVSGVLDSVYAKAEAETLATVDALVKDEDGKGVGTKNVQDADDKKKEDEDEDKEKDKEKKSADSGTDKPSTTDSVSMDSVKSVVAASVKEIRDSLPGLISASVREALGIKDDGDNGAGSGAATGTKDSSKADYSDINISDFVGL